VQAAGGSTLRDWAACKPAETESEPAIRAMYFAERTGARVYFPHISSRLALDEVRKWRKRYDQVWIEPCPHYLTHTQDSDLVGIGKANPPFRSKDDQDALWEALFDGTIDLVASDHSARRRATKDKPLWLAAQGFESRTAESESFGDRLTEFTRGDIGVRTVRERGKWAFDIALPRLTPWYDIGIWAAYLADANASFDLPPLAAQADYLKRHLVDVEASAREGPGIASALSARAWERARARFHAKCGPCRHLLGDRAPAGPVEWPQPPRDRPGSEHGLHLGAAQRGV